jgi:Na+-transporting methylmalonyl-CoA/oxaloacetate decarboxylase gamma subunit
MSRPDPVRPMCERGSATVEFVGIGVLLMVPLVYLVVTMSRLQAASFAADSSAREAARAFVTATDETDGRRRAAIAVRLGLLDQGFTDPRAGDLAVECDPGTDCLAPGGRVLVRVEVRVGLPAVPGFVDDAFSTEVTVRAAQVATVDEFRAGGGNS